MYKIINNCIDCTNVQNECKNVVPCTFFQGSGKTYTVGGGNIASLTEDEYGIIPRAIKEMYEIIQVTKINVITEQSISRNNSYICDKVQKVTF